jgi:hypothetical protein
LCLKLLWKTCSKGRSSFYEVIRRQSGHHLILENDQDKYTPPRALLYSGQCLDSYCFPWFYTNREERHNTSSSHSFSNMVKRSFHSSAVLRRAQPLLFISFSSAIANLKIRSTVHKSTYRVSGPLALGIRPGDTNSEGLDNFSPVLSSARSIWLCIFRVVNLYRNRGIKNRNAGHWETLRPSSVQIKVATRIGANSELLPYNSYPVEQ